MSNTSVPIGEVAEVFNGKTPSRKDKRPSGHPVLKVKDVGSSLRFSGTFGNFVDASFASKYSSRWINECDTLILNSAHKASYVASKLYFAEKEVNRALPVGEWMVIRPNSNRIDPALIYWWFSSAAGRLSLRRVVNGLHLYPKDVASLPVPLPPLDEQRRIVGILDRAAKIERLRAQAQERLREFIPALFIKVFGDPVENPMGWGEKRICDLGSVGSGAGFPRREQGVLSEKLPFLKVSDMNLLGNEIVIQRWNNTISDATRERLRALVFPAGSVIFPKIGAAIATNKKRILICPSCVDNNVMAITPGADMDGEYLYGLMLHKNLKDFASDADPPSMRKTAVENWRIPCPPLSQQWRFAEIIESVRATTKLAHSGQKITASLFASLTNHLLENRA